uniref:L1 transposable element RRM domain-containing protein n=1 Tax=Sinocyclocheilus rhinocerous TaxID=307959 RepID=A0A673L107_9TELE
MKYLVRQYVISNAVYALNLNGLKNIQVALFRIEILKFLVFVFKPLPGLAPTYISHLLFSYLFLLLRDYDYFDMILRSGAKTDTKSKEKQKVTELFKTLKDEIKEFRREFQVFSKDTKEIGELRNDVKELKGTVGDLKMRIQQVEERVAEGEEKQQLSTQALRFFLQQNKLLRERTDYLENKSRQNNIRIYRIKGGSGGTDIVGFVERLLKEACGIAEHLTIVQGHRISATKIPNEKPQPRSIVVRFLTWNMKQRVLQAALGKREITYEGNRVYFDQDFTTKS